MRDVQIIRVNHKSLTVNGQEPLELIVVGHVTVDRVGGEKRLGGAAAYAALAAKKLGANVGVVTSFGDDFPFLHLFEDISMRVIGADKTTTFDNIYADGTRDQRVASMASPLRAEHVANLVLAEDAAVLYCPVVHEIEAPLEPLTPKGLCGVAPQGFYRQWDDAGVVSSREWSEAAHALSRVDVVCLSEDDTEAPEELAENFSGRAFVVTRGAAGCRVYSGVDIYDFPAIPTQEVDPTGAGDVFAATFVLALRDGAAVPAASRVAAQQAAAVVNRPGVDGLL